MLKKLSIALLAAGVVFFALGLLFWIYPPQP